jgi:threonine dehydratase
VHVRSSAPSPVSRAPQRSIDLAAFLCQVLTSPVYDVALETRLHHAPRLSRRVGADVWFKREDLQPTFSFKIRGAYHCIAQLSADERARGVVTASAGNHAQGVALAARHLGMRSVVVLPRTTPSIKIDAVRALAAEIVLIGDGYDDAEREAFRLAAEERLAMIHPFDDPRVIAGQATVAAEVLRQCRHDVSAIFVPVGGGGLIAGVATYVKALRPDVRVFGVEPVDSDAMYRSLAAGHPVSIDQPGLFADGVAVRRVGRHTFPLVRAGVDEIIRVTHRQICRAMKDVFEETRSIVEPAGALAVAGLEAHARNTAWSSPAVAVLSGANMDFDRLASVIERVTCPEPAHT